jgi:plasmid stabilization system protein ParE
MVRRFELEDEAKSDFWNAYDYYSEIDPKLGHEFAEEFDKSVQKILRFPNAGSNIEENFQQILLETFPHYIVYEVIDKKLIMGFAVAHSKRRPGYWQK